MDIRERLEADLARCRADASRVHERAPLIAAAYVQRRLNQLDRRFPRHAWGWAMPTVFHAGVRVIPHVWGEHDADKVVRLALQRFHGRDTLLGIQRVIGDLGTIGKRIKQEFGRPVPMVLSERAQEWNVALFQLPPDTVANRNSRRCEHASGESDRASVAGTKRIWPMHRSGGCGYF